MLGGLLSTAADSRFDNPASRKEWKLWVTFATSVGQDPYLTRYQGSSHHLERLHLFLAFAAALRGGGLDEGKPASGKTIARTLRYCGQILAARGFADPRKAIPGEHHLDPAIQQYIRTCSDEDPAPVRQQAIPAATVKKLNQAYGSSGDPVLRTVASLVVVAFFFLLRVGEYTPHSGTHPRRTIPLRRKDVTLWQGTNAIPIGAPVEQLNQATAVTICLENQKNGKKGNTLHHERTRDPTMCPVQAMVHLVIPINSWGPDAYIGECLDPRGMRMRILPEQIRAGIRHAAALDNLESRGFNLERLGSHSLRAGGAVALKLAGYDEMTIRKMGRWSSDTFLTYIRDQIGNLASGISEAMAMTLSYHNVG